MACENKNENLSGGWLVTQDNSDGVSVETGHAVLAMMSYMVDTGI